MGLTHQNGLQLGDSGAERQQRFWPVSWLRITVLPGAGGFFGAWGTLLPAPQAASRGTQAVVRPWVTPGLQLPVGEDSTKACGGLAAPLALGRSKGTRPEPTAPAIASHTHVTYDADKTCPTPHPPPEGHKTENSTSAQKIFIHGPRTPQVRSLSLSSWRLPHKLSALAWPVGSPNRHCLEAKLHLFPRG